MRAVPGILNDWYIDGNVATIVFGAGLLHALITAPQGVAGQLLDLVNRAEVARLPTLAGEAGVIEIREPGSALRRGQGAGQPDARRWTRR